MTIYYIVIILHETGILYKFVKKKYFSILTALNIKVMLLPAC